MSYKHYTHAYTHTQTQTSRVEYVPVMIRGGQSIFHLLEPLENVQERWPLLHVCMPTLLRQSDNRRFISKSTNQTMHIMLVGRKTLIFSTLSVPGDIPWIGKQAEAHLLHTLQLHRPRSLARVGILQASTQSSEGRKNFNQDTNIPI